MRAKITALVERALQDLTKIVFSRPRDPAILRTVATIKTIRSLPVVQCESFYQDGKAIHRNLPKEEAVSVLVQMAMEDYRQTNLLCNSGTAEIRISAKGKCFLTSKLASATPISPAPPAPHNAERNYILSDKTVHPFLVRLGVSDDRGKIFDKKRSKFRQINRFLEILSDTASALPKDGVLTVCDLCCGKSYLTFAVYWYLTEVLHREVALYGVDRKADVIAFCAEIAEDLGYTGMHFSCGDILDFVPPSRPDLVVSLHACDTATDVVLAEAIRQRARVILSTPCCHHELSGQVNAPSLAFLTKYAILKQKFCDAATDALRAKRLEAEGYTVTVLELIDPEETPKNVMLRAILPTHPVLPAVRAKALSEYRAACALLGASPALDRFLAEDLQNL